MRLVFLGPPGAGKGTQAAWLAEAASTPHISTGDILRRAIKIQTPTGVEAQSYVEKGELVPFAIVLRLVSDRLKEDDCQPGWILDGFPRNLDQAKAFEELLVEQGTSLQSVVYFAASDEVVVERLSGRRTCKECGWTCHAKFAPAAKEGLCNSCNGEMHQRVDDNESSILNRLKVYQEETNPLVSHYRDANKLVEIDASLSVDEVRSSLKAALK